VIDAAAFDLDVVEEEIAVLPGAKTRMWTYGGDFPGPTIRRPVGERTLATFRNKLPAKAGELTVHLHGAHNTSADDGQPGGLTNNLRASMYCDISNRLTPAESGNDLLIEHGGQRTYTYDFVEGGQPERAAMHWYHDHRLDRTSRNVWRGLAGMWISDDALDASLPLPRGSVVRMRYTYDNSSGNPRNPNRPPRRRCSSCPFRGRWPTSATPPRATRSHAPASAASSSSGPRSNPTDRPMRRAKRSRSRT